MNDSRKEAETMTTTTTRRTNEKRTPKKRTAGKRTTKKTVAVAPAKQAVVVVSAKKGEKKDSSQSRVDKAKAKAAEAKTRAKRVLEDKGGLIASAIGVATAAAAGAVAFKTLSGKSRKVYHLMPHEEGWQVTKADAKKPELVRERKLEARSEARDLAHDNEPSQLVIHRQDGTIQTVHTYGE